MIKKTSSESFEILAKLEKECFQAEAWNREQILAHHNTQNSLLYYQENQTSEPVGYLIYMENSFEIEILRVAVLPNFRKIGIAQHLLDYLGSMANGREILLEVKSENSPAISLYEKKGFINFAVRKRYYPDGKDAILMKKESNT